MADLNDEAVTALIERSQTIIADRKGVIAKIDKWGKRHLAYEINKQKDGYYFLIDFAGDGSIVREMERNFRIDDRILKFMTVQKEGASTREGIDQEIADAEAKRAQARAEAEAEASSTEGKTIRQIEKAPADAKSAPRKFHSKDENTRKGE
jgi:small subunit ribosomal protein S6